MLRKFKSFYLQAPEGDSGGGVGTVAVPVSAAGLVTVPVSPPVIAGDTGTGVSAYERELRNENAATRLALSLAKQEAETTKAEVKKLSDALAAQQAEFDRKLEVAVAETKTNLTKQSQKTLIKSALKDKLLDVSDVDNFDLAAIKFTDNGVPEGLDEFVADLKKRKPYIFTDYHAVQTSTGTRSSSSVPTQSGAPAFDASKATPEEYKAAKAALLKAST